MSTIRFNAITYANKLKNAKDNNEFAEIQAEEMSNLINNDLCTKKDLIEIESKLSNEIKNIKNEIIIKLGSLMVAGIAILGFILKLK